jgi:EAL domain-containing protein (putative c-di-GMP-specific phosphodiesterase class I)
MAHALKLVVVAEGVESPSQRALLRQLDCDEMQGYLIAPALPASHVAALLRGPAMVNEALA